MMDQELFELCRAVYERLPGWDNTEKAYAYLQNPYVKNVWAWEVIPLHEDNVDDVDEWHPLYTSDFLLDKLKDFQDAGVGTNTRVWQARVLSDKQLPEYARVRQFIATEAETPLKALLKLVVALNDAGELPR
ncbi:hypothetical protein [Paeniglutamicibacter sp. NPDC091659]|uniref:hypothetical protein n=1 Tax=Paeniglutamicibacter sp. NPDC091659 TaxID=3364389 RepID=UPI0038164DD5